MLAAFVTSDCVLKPINVHFLYMFFVVLGKFLPDAGGKGSHQGVL